MKEPRPAARTSQIVVIEVEKETLVYDLIANKAHCLNDTAASVWRCCTGKNSVAEISDLMEKQYRSPVSDDLVWLALHQLEERELLSDGSTGRTNATGRREMIKRVTIAGVIAAPIIASVIAPESAYAGAGSCVCVNPGACITQTVCPSQSNCNNSGICAP